MASLAEGGPRPMSHWVVDGIETDLERFHLGPVDVTLAPGSALAVLGPSGAGKTTLLRTIAGFLPVRRGHLLRDGVDISRYLPEERGLGYVPQGLGLFPHRTAEQNIRYPLQLRDREDARAQARELLERFHLTALKDRYPVRLSGGEQQRVALARALAAEPELVIWDEPWQALDVNARYELGMILQELLEKDRIPVMLVTHDPALAFSLADSFLVLDRGGVQRRSNAHELLRAPSDPFMARFVGFENVFDRPALEEDGDSPFARWLLTFAGPQGIAFSSGSLELSATAVGPWSAKVRGVRPTPQGWLIELRSGGLGLTLQRPEEDPRPLPSLGQEIRFDIDLKLLHPLGVNGLPGREVAT
jgi:ABC-type Fe3+/spermidine/putrescine transport system ATPase subunit